MNFFLFLKHNLLNYEDSYLDLKKEMVIQLLTMMENYFYLLEFIK